MVRPKKSLGQHFLCDDLIARKIVTSVSPREDDVFFEIGPGKGALTRHLVRSCARLIVVDVDRRLAESLREAYPPDVLDVIVGDILETDISAVARRATISREGKVRVVGNIPYNITSPILFHVLEHRMCITDATLTLQKEVAKRVVAHPGSKDYGILSVFCQLYADCELLFEIPPSAFTPEPKVRSGVISMFLRTAPRYALPDEEFFRIMVRAVFGKRRKTLRNSLRYLVGDGVTDLEGEIDLGQRPEELSLKELASLSALLSDRLTQNP
jgi:16S rRNA (adenine1518-N6/adenine1519-N6)-dimethyltransferase